MTAYILSRETARHMCAIWFSSGLSLSNPAAIHNACSMFTVYDALGSSLVSLKELRSSDEVRISLTPGHEIEQEELIPYGNILSKIIQCASKATPFASDAPASFIIMYDE